MDETECKILFHYRTINQLSRYGGGEAGVPGLLGKPRQIRLQEGHCARLHRLYEDEIPEVEGVKPLETEGLMAAKCCGTAIENGQSQP